MDSLDKKSLSERDICTTYITPALPRAGWDLHNNTGAKVLLDCPHKKTCQTQLLIPGKYE